MRYFHCDTLSAMILVDFIAASLRCTYPVISRWTRSASLLRKSRSPYNSATSFSISSTDDAGECVDLTAAVGRVWDFHRKKATGWPLSGAAHKRRGIRARGPFVLWCSQSWSTGLLLGGMTAAATGRASLRRVQDSRLL